MNKYSIDVENLYSLAYVLNELNDCICGLDYAENWDVNVNAGGIDYGIYINVDIDRRSITICNQPNGNEDFGLEDVIEFIEERYGDKDEFDDEDEEEGDW